MEVAVTDENDSPPRWSRERWSVEVEEGGQGGDVLATLTVRDPDTHNRLAYRVSLSFSSEYTFQSKKNNQNISDSNY